ncbi:YlbF family regulator [Halomarina oriensis]|uniref:YlbF family regulator n=1 Tax=Halomarina oriensis TaxID=671145 RepID=A0A6B0GJN3_9EURY|nr:YlbF family regulator [Halomarina oriensis]MWG33609.1 YlbF family regulator [Halomarina oriensis]
MSIETTPESDEMAAAARATELAGDLGTAIADLPAYREFAEAKQAVEDSEEAQEKIQVFEQKREEFMLARQTGNASNEDLRELQEAQEELHDIPVMSEYLRAQSDLELQLQELNEMISAPLSVDFGEKAGGCCQD